MRSRTTLILADNVVGGMEAAELLELLLLKLLVLNICGDV